MKIRNNEHVERKFCVLSIATRVFSTALLLRLLSKCTLERCEYSF